MTPESSTALVRHCTTSATMRGIPTPASSGPGPCRLRICCDPLTPTSAQAPAAPMIEVMAMLKAEDLGIPLQFQNFRD